MSTINASNGRFDLPSVGSDMKSRDKLNQLPGRIGTMRQWLVDQVRQLRGLDFTDKKKEDPKPAPKAEEPKKDEKPADDKKKDK